MTEHRTVYMSDDRVYRYWLKIIWDESLPLCTFIGLNPSTADEFQDDPTIRRCKGYARDWGCGGLLMLNVFALRSTDPQALYRADDPVGPENILDNLDEWSAASKVCVAAWGTHGNYMNGRGRRLARRLSGLQALQINADGTPKHPLYCKKNVVLVSYGGAQ